MTEGRVGWEEKIKNCPFEGPKIWFHCASLGEFEQGRPLIEHLKKSYPTYGIFITFFSSSGYEVRKNYEMADFIDYLPFDSKQNAIKFVRLLDPSMAIFIKYEFWYHYLAELKNNKIPTFSVSAIFRKEQHFFKKNGQFFRKMLACFDQFFVQNMVSKTLLNEQGIDNVIVSGDTRFDRVMEICSAPVKNEIARLFKANEKIMIIGSSWPEDINVLLSIINTSHYNLKFIIAPHEVEKSKIKKLCSEITVDFELYSEVNNATIHQKKVLIIDNIGILSSLFQYGDIGYIGGAFGEGLHNILEAATFGMPILFGRGKDNSKYQEAVDLVELGGAFEIADAKELENVLNKLMNNTSNLENASEISSEYVKRNAGATNKIMEYLCKYLN